MDVGRYVERARAHIAEHLQLPPGYSISWSGQYEYMERAKAKPAHAVPLTLLIIVVLLYMNSRSFAPVEILMGRSHWRGRARPRPFD